MSAPLDQAPPADGASPVVPPHLQTFLALDFGIKRTGFAVGNRLMRTAQPQGTIAAEGDGILNRWLFAGGDRQVRDVLVNGQWVVRDGRHAGEEESNRAFTRVLRDLLG